MATATLRTLGDSVVMVIPKAILEQARLRSSAQAEIEYRDGHLVIEPRAKPKYTLAELLARCDAGSLALSDEDAEWLNDGPAGREAQARGHESHRACMCCPCLAYPVRLWRNC